MLFIEILYICAWTECRPIQNQTHLYNSEWTICIVTELPHCYRPIGCLQQMDGGWCTEDMTTGVSRSLNEYSQSFPLSFWQQGRNLSRFHSLISHLVVVRTVGLSNNGILFLANVMSQKTVTCLIDYFKFSLPWENNSRLINQIIDCFVVVWTFGMFCFVIQRLGNI